jgi:hypothetical protein
VPRAVSTCCESAGAFVQLLEALRSRVRIEGTTTTSLAHKQFFAFRDTEMVCPELFSFNTISFLFFFGFPIAISACFLNSVRTCVKQGLFGGRAASRPQWQPEVTVAVPSPRLYYGYPWHAFFSMKLNILHLLLLSPLLFLHRHAPKRQVLIFIICFIPVRRGTPACAF